MFNSRNHYESEPYLKQGFELIAMDSKSNSALSIGVQIKLWSQYKAKLEAKFTGQAADCFQRFCRYLKSVALYRLNYSIHGYAREFGTMAGFDFSKITELLNPLDFLDVLIDTQLCFSPDRDREFISELRKYTDNQTDLELDIFIKAFAASTTLFHHLILEEYKLRYNFNIDFYKNSLQAHNQEMPIALSDEMVRALVADQAELEVVDDFFESRDKYPNLYRSGEFHLAALMLESQRLLNQYDEKITVMVNGLLNASLVNRMTNVKNIKERLLNEHNIATDLSCCRFFSFLEVLQCEDPKLTMNYGKPVWFNQATVDRFKAQAMREAGADISQLWYHIIQLENVMLEYLYYAIYMKYGLKYSRRDLTINDTAKKIAPNLSNLVQPTKL